MRSDGLKATLATKNQLLIATQVLLQDAEIRHRRFHNGLEQERTRLHIEMSSLNRGITTQSNIPDSLRNKLYDISREIHALEQQQDRNTSSHDDWCRKQLDGIREIEREIRDLQQRIKEAEATEEAEQAEKQNLNLSAFRR